MALNKNALIRYKTIDKCLQNHFRKWTLNNLIDACSDALYEFEGRDVSVSKRTVQLDIQLMRSNKLGYNAPIEVYDRKYYRYEDENFSITDIPITENDMNVLTETVEMLKQFKDFSLFSELGGIIQKLEDKVYTEKTDQEAIIHLDKNDGLKGLEHLDVVYQAILKKICLKIEYQSFKAIASSEIIFHPYILKEFNNRWFIVGRKDPQPSIMTLALDRIINLGFELSIDYKKTDFNGDDYYKHTIGVTVLNNNQLKKVVLKFDKINAPYVLTKPLHHTQKMIEKFEDGSISFEIRVHHNYEFERLVLGFGASVEVLDPPEIRLRFKRMLKRAVNKYDY